MIVIYRVIINIILILSPIIFIIRYFKKKETFKSFKEKLCFFSEKKISGKLIWFHAASVGEFQSIIPILEKFEKNKSIRQILVTSNTLSSSKVISKLKFRKLVHQFFPIDTNLISKKFLNYWSPSAAFFVDSEIWPNTIFNLKDKKIPIILLNGRITKKSFNRWIKLRDFSNDIFNKFSLCLSSNNETKNYLKKLGAQNIKTLGNLKFSKSKIEEKLIKKDYQKPFLSRNLWCAASTHETEEIFCALIHKKLKKKFSNLITIIIPRHINRTNSIKTELINLGLNVHIHEPQKKIKDNTDVYLVNTYGKSKLFYNNCKNVFLGGSIINHGGQNPLEPARYGCNVFYGPNVSNFKEIYKFLNENKVAFKIRNQIEMVNRLSKIFKKKNNSRKIQKKINKIGSKILNITFKEINLIVNKNEI